MILLPEREPSRSEIDDVIPTCWSADASTNNPMKKKIVSHSISSDRLEKLLPLRIIAAAAPPRAIKDGSTPIKSCRRNPAIIPKNTVSDLYSEDFETIALLGSILASR